MDVKSIIDNFDSIVSKTINENNLISKSIELKKTERFIRQKAIDSRLKYNIIKDIDSTQSDLIYCTGILFLLRPYINNPLKELMSTEQYRISTYYQNLYDSLYLMYSSICFEKLYNFWDRIGDKIVTILSIEFKNPKQIMFANVIDKVKLLNIDNENISWLINFRETEFNEFNEHRKVIVHHEQSDTKFYESITNNSNDRAKVERLYQEKSNLPEFLKKHIELTNKGLEYTFNLIGLQ